jgi:hypothetical protein
MQRFDWDNGLCPPNSLPVRKQLVAMKRRPSLNQPHCCLINLAGDELAIDVDRCPLAAMVRMKVRRRVRALIPIHVDGDATEEADPRQAMNPNLARDCLSISPHVGMPLPVLEKTSLRERPRARVPERQSGAAIGKW